jgi:alpha-glucuronidase
MFGRLAWDPHASSRDIARDWTVLTFSTDRKSTEAIVEMMMRSREAVVDYMTPLGLHHLMDTGHHYGRDRGSRSCAGPNGTRLTTTRPTGRASASTARPRAAMRSRNTRGSRPAMGDPNTTSDQFLLWFHHLPWNFKMPSGRTLWDELIARYDRGVAGAGDLRKRWDRLKNVIDPRRHREVREFLQIQNRRPMVARCLDRVLPHGLGIALRRPRSPAAHARAIQVPPDSVGARPRPAALGKTPAPR